MLWILTGARHHREHHVNNPQKYHINVERSVAGIIYCLSVTYSQPHIKRIERGNSENEPASRASATPTVKSVTDETQTIYRHQAATHEDGSIGTRHRCTRTILFLFLVFGLFNFPLPFRLCSTQSLGDKLLAPFSLMDILPTVAHKRIKWKRVKKPKKKKRHAEKKR